MADLAGELRHAIEATVQQLLNAQAEQRGWDEGASARVSIDWPGGAPDTNSYAVQFATGYDGSLTTAAFMFGVSVLGGPDILI